MDYTSVFVKCCLDELKDSAWYEILSKTMYETLDDIRKENGVFIAKRGDKNLYQIPSTTLLVTVIGNNINEEFKKTRYTSIEDGNKYAWIPKWYLRYYFDRIMRNYGIVETCYGPI